MSQVRNPFVRAAAEEFLRTKAAREKKTQAAYFCVLVGSEQGTKPALGVALSAFFQNRRFKSVSHDEVAQWFAQRVSGGAQDTKARISRNSRAFFRWARERGYTDLNLDSAIDPFKAGGPRVDWLDWSQIHRLLPAIPEERYRFAAAWLFYTGCRVGEACRARHRDVRQNGELYQWTIRETKTHDQRLVWLPDELATRLEIVRGLVRPKPDWPLLWDCAGRGFSRQESYVDPITPHTINAALERARDAVGIPIAVTAHVAKHSYCSNWIQQFGASELAMEKLSRQVGTSVTNLRKTYVHVSLNDADWEAIRGFGARFA